MFDVGFAEVFLLGLIGLLVLGPERLPAVARTLGGYVRKARSSWYSLKRSVEAELAAAEAASPLKAAKEELESVQKQVNEIGQSLNQTITPTAATPAADTEPGADDGTAGDATAGPETETTLEAPDKALPATLATEAGADSGDHSLKGSAEPASAARTADKT